MNVPKVEYPERYTGLYVFDFGVGQTAVGYTADEVAVLLESDRYKDGKVYRIHRAMPDGSMELQGVTRERFLTEEGLFFYRSDAALARQDLDELDALAQRTPAPCRIKAHLARFEPGESDGGRASYATVIIYPAEYSSGVSKWLNDADYRGGDRVEGGISPVSDYYAMQAPVLERRQWWSASIASRSSEEVLATTHLAIQRRMAG